jgi:hypothetical protein
MMNDRVSLVSLSAPGHLGNNDEHLYGSRDHWRGRGGVSVALAGADLRTKLIARPVPEVDHRL